MAWDQSIESITRVAGADLSTTGIYRFVKQNSDGEVILCSVAGEAALGVLQNNPIKGQAATVAYGDVLKITAGGTITPGDQLTTDNQGRAVTEGGGDSILGECLAGASVGNIGTMLFMPQAASGTVLVTNQDTLLQSATVTVSSAELLALHATPKSLVAAPGAGYALALDSAILFVDYNSAAYAGIAGAEDLEIRYTNGSGALLATIETTGFLDATADAVRYVLPVTTAAMTPADNAALILCLASGEITTGNSPLKVKINYRVIPTSL